MEDLNLPTSKTRYDKFAAVSLISKEKLPLIIPTPKQLTVSTDDRPTDPHWQIYLSSFFSAHQQDLEQLLKQTLTVIAAVIVVALLFWFLERTRTGKSMRAYADNEDLALLSGINPERVVMVTWMIVAALATIAGTLYGLDKVFKPFTYLLLLLPIFSSAIVGGLGNPVGAIAGGFVIAFSEVTITYAWKKVVTYLVPSDWAPSSLVQLLSTDYKFAVSFSILIIVLLFRPTGLFKGKAY